MPSAKTATDTPTGPTAQQKRDMAAVARAEAVLRVPGTPYVVLSFDGPVDTARLANALGAPSAAPASAVAPNGEDLETTPGTMQVLSGDPFEALEHRTLGELGFATAIPDDDQDEDDDGGVDEDDEPEDEPAEPHELVHAYLTEHGPSDVQSIARETGLSRMQAATAITRLITNSRVRKNGLAYAAA